ncbi:hypothetical protein FSP39_002621 [Pinctada imbricata]|uniref:Uncharacterized protein n=1 Tax=Pinctada imbricata TaxID=66713 RepID=A0AA89C161_PINIB|nr:hypothetical protein FSP39_002621 [Pinctada imbricata]
MASGRRSRMQMDNNDQSNWTVSFLKGKLAENGIKINAQVGHSVLKRINIDNVGSSVNVSTGTVISTASSNNPSLNSVVNNNLTDITSPQERAMSSASLSVAPSAIPENASPTAQDWVPQLVGATSLPPSLPQLQPSGVNDFYEFFKI